MNKKYLSTMKKVSYLGICVLALMLGLGLGSCSKDEYHSRLKELIIKDVDFDSDGGDYTKEFRNEDLTYYKAVPDSSWCTVTIDAKTSKMTVTVKDNESFDNRSCIVTLQDIKDGVTSRTFTVKQKQKNCIKIGANSYAVSTDGGQVVIDVESNVDYVVSIAKDCDWITRPKSGTRGLVKSSVVLDVNRNTSEKERSAIVTLENTTTGDKEEVLITQEFKAYFSLIQNEFSISENGGEINVYIQTNISSFDCYLTDGDNWIKKSGRESVAINTICQKLMASAFKEKSASRETVVTFENASYGFSETVTITQNRMLYIKENDQTIYKGDSLKLTLYNKTGEAVKWSSKDEGIATVNESGWVKGLAKGDTKIRVYSADSMYGDSITITVQKAEDLGEKLNHDWKRGFKTEGGVTALSSLSCILYNNSEFDIVLTKVTCYQDDEVLGYMNFNAKSGALNIGDSKTYSNDIPLEYEDESSSESESEDEGDSDDTKKDDDTNKDEDTSKDDSTTEDDSSSNGTRADDTKKLKVNTHTYTFVWEYTYKGEKFTYKCETKGNEEENAKSSARWKTSSKRSRR